MLCRCEKAQTSTQAPEVTRQLHKMAASSNLVAAPSPAGNTSEPGAFPPILQPISRLSATRCATGQQRRLQEAHRGPGTTRGPPLLSRGRRALAAAALRGGCPPSSLTARALVAARAAPGRYSRGTEPRGSARPRPHARFGAQRLWGAGLNRLGPV